MEFKIDLEEAFTKAFGVRRPIYVPVTKPVIGQDKNFKNSNSKPVDPIEFQDIKKLKIDTSSIKSSLGTLVLSPIKFIGGSYKERLGNGQLRNSNYDEFVLPATSTIEVSFRKIVVKTQLRGGRGTYKEQVGTSDAVVRIRGIFIGEDLKRPEDAIRKLSNLEKVPSEIAVSCDYLSWVGIDYLVIESLSFPELKGSPSMQPFQIDCLSDRPVQLILKNGS